MNRGVGLVSCHGGAQYQNAGEKIVLIAKN